MWLSTTPGWGANPQVALPSTSPDTGMSRVSLEINCIYFCIYFRNVVLAFYWKLNYSGMLTQEKGNIMSEELSAEALQARMYIKDNVIHWKPVDASNGSHIKDRQLWNERYADKPVKVRPSKLGPYISFNRRGVGLAAAAFALQKGQLPALAEFINGEFDLNLANIKVQESPLTALGQGQRILKAYEESKFMPARVALGCIRDLVKEIQALQALA